MKRFALLVTLWMGVPITAVAQKTPNTVPQTTIEATTAPTPTARHSPSISGQVAIEDPAPTFELDGSNGRSIRLTAYRGYWTVLAFADRWQQLDPLHGVDDGMRELGARVVGICHEKAHTLVGAAGRGKMPVLLLADVTGEVSATYGLYDFVRSETEPGLLIIDPQGVVQLAVLGHLPPPDSIVRLAKFFITGI